VGRTVLKLFETGKEVYLFCMTTDGDCEYLWYHSMKLLVMECIW